MSKIKKGQGMRVLLAGVRKEGILCFLKVSGFGNVARVAQLDRVAPSEGEGCGFNSRHAHHFWPLAWGDGSTNVGRNNRLFMKSAIPWVCVLALLGGVYFLYSAGKTKEAELVQLRQQADELAKVRAENEDLKKLTAQVDEVVRLRKDNEDLLRLRNEVKQLRDQGKELTGKLQVAQSQGAQVQLQQQELSKIALENQALRTQTQQFQQANAQNHANACINNLRQIDGAKQQWALEHTKQPNAIPTLADIQPYLANKGAGMICPAGGSYTLNSLQAAPSCSVPGHVIQ
ncbi:MAG: hypothetical protein JWR69_991 [Pedosphaera sp.]|nr:hypothetical protein [Pedosphaera sp.]